MYGMYWGSIGDFTSILHPFPAWGGGAINYMATNICRQYCACAVNTWLSDMRNGEDGDCCSWQEWREKEMDVSRSAAGKMNCWWQPKQHLPMFCPQIMNDLFFSAMDRKLLESPTTTWGMLGGLHQELTFFVAPVLGYLTIVHIKLYSPPNPAH